MSEIEHNAEEVADWIEAYMMQIKPAAARALARKIGRYLRTANRKTMRAQTTPSGKPWPKRLPQERKPKNKKMFVRLAQLMSVKLIEDAVSVGWHRSRTARIATVHHEGLSEPGSFGGVISYARRELIGLTPAMLDDVRQIVLEHMSEAA